jgi:hypothetical protein
MQSVPIYFSFCYNFFYWRGEQQKARTDGGFAVKASQLNIDDRLFGFSHWQEGPLQLGSLFAWPERAAADET